MFEGLFQPIHLLVILGIALLVFGPKKLPELGRGLGNGIRGFKDAVANRGTDAEPVQKDQATRHVEERRPAGLA